MKAIRAILLLLAIGLSAYGQAVNVTANKIKGSATAPSGTCSAQQVQLTTAGVIWTCQSGTWGSASGSSGLTVGTTTITSGTNTRVLYNNSGVVGEYAITGTGNVVMSANPTLTGTLTTAAIVSSGHHTFTPDNTYDIGASGATRPRYAFIGSSVEVGASGTLVVTSSGGGSNGAILQSTSGNGILKLTNWGNTDFTRLQFGGSTASFGAIGRDGAGIKIVGGDGTSVSWIKVPGVTVATLPAAATAGVGARSFVTDALTPVFGSTVTGGGTVAVPVYSDGANWIVG